MNTKNKGTRRPALMRGAFVFTALAALCLLPPDTASAARFEPAFSTVLKDPTPSFPSDIEFNFSLREGDVNVLAGAVYFPEAWQITPGDELPVGLLAAILHVNVVLGLIGSSCNVLIPVGMDLYNASLDRSETVSMNDEDGDATGDYAEDEDANGLYDAIDRYPDFIGRVLGTDEPPLRRLAGIVPLAGIPWLLQVLFFEPGTPAHPLLPHDESGYPAVVLLQDYGDPQAVPRPGPVTDFCTPLSGSMTLLGRSEGRTLMRNPLHPGRYSITAVAAGHSDADGDGIENPLDTCPFTPNAGNPRITNSGDADGDGLDAACDPNDQDLNSDQDGDFYLNRQDNCPLVGNGQNTNNQADADFDEIGDSCDPDPFTPSGPRPVKRVEASAVIGNVQGDTDCDGNIDSVDALLLLREIAGLWLRANCLSLAGDVNCDGSRTATDALALLRFVVALPIERPPGCPAIGAVIQRVMPSA